MQDLQFKLIHNPKMYQKIQPNICGGICYASGRYACVNNRFMKALYRQNNPELFIMYIDTTYLYG